MITVVRTVSGSTYEIEERPDGTFWLTGDNVPNPNSVELAGTWEIERPTPWPPNLGQRLFMPAPGRMWREDPLRIPGGGKWTSPVRTWEYRFEVDA